MTEWWVWSSVNSVALLAIAAVFGYALNRRRDGKVEAVATALRLVTEEKERANRLAAEERARAKELADAQALLLARVIEAEKELAVFKATMSTALLPVSAMFQAALVTHLTHNHTPEMDDLLARINALTETEEQRLFVLLQERVVEFDDPEIGDLERDAAVMMPYVMKRVKAEAAAAAVPQATIADAAMVSQATIVIAKPEGAK